MPQKSPAVLFFYIYFKLFVFSACLVLKDGYDIFVIQLPGGVSSKSVSQPTLYLREAIYRYGLQESYDPGGKLKCRTGTLTLHRLQIRPSSLEARGASLVYLMARLFPHQNTGTWFWLMVPSL